MNEVEQNQFDEVIRQRDVLLAELEKIDQAQFDKALLRQDKAEAKAAAYRSVLHKLDSELCQSGAVWETSKYHDAIKDVLKDD